MAVTLDPATCRVALLAGGTSGEREISLASGKGAGEALRQAGFAVTELDPASKDDLKALIDGNFDVAFLCLHGKGGASRVSGGDRPSLYRPRRVVERYGYEQGEIEGLLCP